MRALITNFGTTGDVLPLLALGCELRRGGHEVVMAFSPSHHDVITGHGFAFVPTGPDQRDLQDSINERWMTDEAIYTSNAEMERLLQPLEAALPHTYETLRTLARGCDLLISGPSQPAARMVHETMAIPFVSVQFSNFGGSGAPALQAASAALVNPFRQRLGLRPLANPVTLDANSPQLALYAMSRHLIPRASTWPEHYHVVGFFFLPVQEWRPDHSLRRFLDAGSAPAIVSFGSMPHADAGPLVALLQEAALLARVRIVFQHAGAHDDCVPSPDLVHVTGFALHRWLFPRGCCIVHHGGAGTAASAFLSGRPTVYVPHGQIFDQHYWAQLSRDCGCSGDPVPISALTADRLAACIRECVDRPERLLAAARLGSRVGDEHGVRTARRLIEQLVANVGLGDGDRSPAHGPHTIGV